MRKILCSLTILCMLSVAAKCNTTKILPTESCNLPAYNLQNSYLKLTIIPQSNGRISALDYRPDNLPLFQKYTETREKVSPLLPKIVLSNRNGYKLWLWGKNSMANCNLKVSNTVNNEQGMNITMNGRNYMAQPFMITQAIALPRNAAVVNIKTTILNASPTSKYITLWINSVPAEVGQTIYPIKGGLKRVQGRSVKQVNMDMLLRQNTQAAPNFFAAPVQPWIARSFPQQKLIMAYVTDAKNLIPGGLFYTWHGAKAGEKITSLEMIFAPRKVGAKQAVKFNSRIMVFKGLENLKTICDDIGIDCKAKVTGDKVKIKLFLNSVISQTKLELKVGLVPIEKIESALLGSQQLSINKLIPGNNHSSEFTIPVKGLSGKYYFTGKINGKKFLVLDVITLKR